METVLLIEENAAFAKLIAAKLLKETGCHTVTVPSPAGAEQLLNGGGHKFILAITDTWFGNKQDCDGVDLLLARNTPTIAMSAEYDEKLHKSLSEKYIIDFILKRTTEDLNVLAAAVRRVLHNRNIPILVVDDSAPYRVAMNDILKSQLYTVYEAANGQEALEQLDKRPEIKIVITDYYMPVMDGFEFVTRARRKRKRESLAIIVLSGAQKEDVAAKFLKFGANDYIKKPFSNEEFNCRVNLNADYIEMVEGILRAANTDYMTGLLNRRSFFEKAEEYFKATGGSRLAVAMLDIDHFKKVNDTYGHDAGDAAIRGLARLLTANIPPDCLVSRFGGEEFCVLIKGADASQAKRQLEQVRQLAEQNDVEHDGKSFRCTISIGVCAKPGLPLEEMINQADVMLYEAKHGGRNRIRAV